MGNSVSRPPAPEDASWLALRSSTLFDNSFVAMRSANLVAYDVPSLSKPPTSEEVASAEPPSSETRFAEVLSSSRGLSKRGPPCKELSVPGSKSQLIPGDIQLAPFFRLLKMRCRLLNKSFEAIMSLPVSLPSVPATTVDPATLERDLQAMTSENLPEYLLRLLHQRRHALRNWPALVSESSDVDISLITSVRMSMSIVTHLKDAVLTIALFDNLTDMLMTHVLAGKVNNPDKFVGIYPDLIDVLEFAASFLRDMSSTQGQAAVVFWIVAHVCVSSLTDVLPLLLHLATSTPSFALSPSHAATLMTVFRTAVDIHPRVVSLPLSLVSSVAGSVTLSHTVSSPQVTALAASQDGSKLFIRSDTRVLALSVSVTDGIMTAEVSSASPELLLPTSNVTLIPQSTDCLLASGCATHSSPLQFSVLSMTTLAPVGESTVQLCLSREPVASTTFPEPFIISGQDLKTVHVMYKCKPPVVPTVATADDAKAVIIDTFDVSVLQPDVHAVRSSVLSKDHSSSLFGEGNILSRPVIAYGNIITFHGDDNVCWHYNTETSELHGSCAARHNPSRPSSQDELLKGFASLAFVPQSNTLWGFNPSTKTLRSWPNAGVAPSLSPAPLFEACQLCLDAREPVTLSQVAAVGVERIANKASCYAKPSTFPFSADQHTRRYLSEIDSRNDAANVHMAVEPTLVVLVALWNTLRKHAASDSVDAVVMTLRVLQAQIVDVLARGGCDAIFPSYLYSFPSLFHAGVFTQPPPTFLLTDIQQETPKLHAVFQSLRATLMSLIQPDAGVVVDERVAQLAAQALVAGLPLFFPTGSEQVSLLTSLLRNPSGLRRAESILLDTLLASLSSFASAAALMQQLSIGADSSNAAAADLVHSLAAITARDAHKLIAEAVAAASSEDSKSIEKPPQTPALALLESLVKCALSILAKPREPSTEVSQPMVAVVIAAVVQSNALLRHCVSVLEGFSGNKLALCVSVDAVLRASPACTLLPLIVSSLSSIGTSQPDVLLACASIDPTAAFVFTELLSTVSTLWSMMSDAGFAENTMVTSTISGEDTIIIESPHPYENSQDIYQWVEVPNAVSYTITADQQSQSETNCDYVIFYTDKSHNAMHGERYTGSNWPGKNAAVLTITAPSFEFYFHSDGSGTEWGYKFTIKAKMFKSLTVPQSRVLHELQDAVAFLVALQSATLVRSSGVTSHEELDKDGWMDSQLLKGGLEQSNQPSDVTAFLNDVINATPGSVGASFAKTMRFLVSEDTGTVDYENVAVTTAAVAALKLSGLAPQAKAFAESNTDAVTDAMLALGPAKRRTAARKLKSDLNVSEALLATWAGVQSLRAVIHQGTQGKVGSDETGSRQIAEVVQKRAEFLLTLNSAVSSEGVGGGVAKKRWQLAAHKAAKLADTDSTAADSPAPDGSKFLELVDELKLASELKALMAIRQSSLMSVAEAGVDKLHELVRKFCSAVTSSDVGFLTKGLLARSQRAQWRVMGFKTAARVLNDVNSTTDTTVWTLQSLMTAFQSIGYQPMHKLSGAPSQQLADVSAAFSELLSCFGALLRGQLSGELAALQMNAVAGVTATAHGGLVDGVLPPKPPVLSRFESTKSFESGPSSRHLAAQGSSRSLSSPVVTNAWLPLFAPEAFARLSWLNVMRDNFSATNAFPLTPDDLTALWRNYAPRNGSMTIPHFETMLSHLKDAFESCMPAAIEGLQLRSPAEASSIIITLPQLLSMFDEVNTLAAVLASAIDTDSDGTVSRAEFFESFKEHLTTQLYHARQQVLEEDDDESEGGSGTSSTGSDSGPAWSAPREIRQQVARRGRRDRRRSPPYRRTGSGYGGEEMDSGPAWSAPREIVEEARNERRRSRSRSRSPPTDADSGSYFRVRGLTQVRQVRVGGPVAAAVRHPQVISTSLPRGGRNVIDDVLNLPSSPVRASSPALRNVDRVSVSYFATRSIPPPPDVLEQPPEGENPATEQQTVTKVEELESPERERKRIVLAVLRAAQLHYTTADHDALQSSGLLDCVADILLGRFQDDLLTSFSKQLDELGVTGDSKAAAVRQLRESVQFSPDFICNYAHRHAMSVLRVVVMTCIGSPDKQSPIGELATATLLAVVRHVLSRSDDGGTSAVDDSQATEGSDDAGVNPEVAASEIALIPPSATIPLSVSGCGGSNVTGLVAPHFDLDKDGWSIGWRMYWPREDQQTALASGSVRETDTGVALDESGLIFLKGWQWMNASLRGRMPSFQMVGARTVPGKRIQFFVSSKGTEVVSVLSQSAVPVGKWCDVVASYGPNPESGDQPWMKLYVNGSLQAEAPLGPSLFVPTRTLGTETVVVEGPHPYFDNMETTHPVRVPGAVKFTITFHEDTRTEGTHDHVSFFKDESRGTQFGVQYSGGRGGGSRNFPGVDGNAPLEIEGDSFIACFHSDGSNVDWGFRFTAVAEVPVSIPIEKFASDPDGKSIDNASPFYFGCPPSRVSNESAAPVVLSDVRLQTHKQLSPEDVLARWKATQAEFRTSRLQTLLSHRPDQTTDRLIDVLALAANASHATSSLSNTLSQPDVLAALLPLAFPQPLSSVPVAVEVRLSALRVLKAAVSSTALSELDESCRTLFGGASFAQVTLQATHTAVNVWRTFGDSGSATAHLPASHTVGFATELVALCRQLAVESPAFASDLVAGIQSLTGLIDAGCVAASTGSTNVPDLSGAFTALAVFGGEFVGLTTGARVTVSGKGYGTLLALDFDTNLAVVACDTDNNTPTRLPFDAVSVVPAQLSSQVVCLGVDVVGQCVDAFQDVLAIGVGRSQQLAPHRIPTPLQSAFAELQSRTLLMLTALVTAVNDANVGVDAGVKAALMASLSNLVPGFTALARSLPTAQINAKPDPCMPKLGSVPDSLKDLLSQVTLMLDQLSEGPRPVWQTALSPAGVLTLSPSVFPAATKPRKQADRLPLSCAFLNDDIVASREAVDSATGVVLGVGENDTSDDSDLLPLSVNTLVRVQFPDGVVDVPESKLILVNRPPKAATADASDEVDKSSIFYVTQNSSGDSDGGSVGAKWQYVTSLDCYRTRLWGGTAGLLNLITAQTAKDIVMSILSNTAALPLRSGDVSVASLTGFVSALFRLTSGALINSVPGPTLLQRTAAEAIVALPHGVELASQLLSMSAGMLSGTLKVAQYQELVTPPPSVKTYESKHDYENNTNEEIDVRIRGARKMTIVFDAKSKTESGCDWLQFMSPTGSDIGSRLSGETFPGKSGEPPLVIDGDYCKLVWRTDGSTVYWGWKFTVTGDMPEVDRSHIKPPELSETEKVSDVPTACFLTKLALSVLTKAELSQEQLNSAALAAVSIMRTVIDFLKLNGADTGALIDMAREIAGNAKLLMPQYSKALAALKAADRALFEAAATLVWEESKAQVKSTALKVQMDATAAMRQSLTAFQAAKHMVRRASDASASVVTSTPTAGVDPGDVDVSVEIVDATAPSPAVTEETQSTIEPADNGWVTIGHPWGWRPSGSIQKPVLIMPFAFPSRGQITMITLRLSGASRPDFEAIWFLMTFEVRDNRAVIWSGRSVEVDTTVVDGQQLLNFESAPIRVEAGQFIGLACHGGNTNIACEETPAGCLAYSMNDPPDFSQAGESLAVQRDSKAKYYGLSFVFQPDDLAAFDANSGALVSTGVCSRVPPASAEHDPLDEDGGDPFAGLFGSEEDATPRVTAQKTQTTSEQQTEDDKKQAAADTEKAVKKLIDSASALLDISEGKPPLALLNPAFFAQLSTSRAVTLVSPEGFDGKQLAGARAGGSECESKGETEVESDSKTDGSSESTGPAYLHVNIPHAASVKVALSAGSQLPRSKGLFAKNLDDPACSDVLVLPLVESSQVTLESQHPYENNMDEYRDVTIPGASSLVITFDARTRTENGCDYVRFMDKKRVKVYSERNYTGGQNGNSQQLFPGLCGIPPLVVPGDSVTMHFHSDGSSVDWGYLVTIKAVGLQSGWMPFTGSRVALTLKDVTEDEWSAAFKAVNRPDCRPSSDPDSLSYNIIVAPEFTDASLASSEDLMSTYHRYLGNHRAWTPSADARLLQWMQECVIKTTGGNLLVASWTDIIPPVDESKGVTAERRAAIIDEAAVKFAFAVPTGTVGEDRLAGVRDRGLILQQLNQMVVDVIEFVDLQRLRIPGSYANLLTKCRHVIVSTSRMPLLAAGLSATTGGGGETTLNLDFGKARDFYATGEADVDGVFTVFGQAAAKMNSFNPKTLRRAGQLYKVNDTSPVNFGYGLDQTDAGGPYRSSYSTYCRELQSPSLSLLIPTPNAKMNTGVNREMYVPNPKATSSAETQMFEFLGKLFGIAIRNKENLNLSIASVVWKRIVGEEADASDLAAIDQNSVSYITLIRDAKESDAIFTQDTQYFVCDGAELKPGGSSIPLTFANRNEYADLFVAHRLHQFDERIDVIIRGMACMIPVRVLSLFSASEVEEMVCGSTVINTDQLKKHTTYEGCAETDSHIQHFWAAFDTLSQEDRRRLVSFAYGRSRLPRNYGDLQHRFKLTVLNPSGNPDGYLPLAHTCFFHIELPRYTSAEICRAKLLIAIYS